MYWANVQSIFVLVAAAAFVPSSFDAKVVELKASVDVADLYAIALFARFQKVVVEIEVFERI